MENKGSKGQIFYTNTVEVFHENEIEELYLFFTQFSLFYENIRASFKEHFYYKLLLITADDEKNFP